MIVLETNIDGEILHRAIEENSNDFDEVFMLSMNTRINELQEQCKWYDDSLGSYHKNFEATIEATRIEERLACVNVLRSMANNEKMQGMIFAPDAYNAVADAIQEQCLK